MSLKYVPSTKPQDPFLVAYVNLKLAACGASPVKMTPKVPRPLKGSFGLAVLVRPGPFSVKFVRWTQDVNLRRVC